MEKEFIPYEQALALKELGFDEPCFAVYIDKTLIMEDDWLYSTNQDTFIESSNFTAPLYQQAFRWFREEHKLIAGIFPNNHSLQNNVSYIGYVGKFKKGGVEVYKTYEEAELECLKKLIEIIKK